jgi:hypothetical protein
MFIQRLKLTQTPLWTYFLIVFTAVLVKKLEGYAIYPQRGQWICNSGATYWNHTISGGIQAGDFKKVGIVPEMEVCKKQCCDEQKCDVALVAKQVCYLVSCDNEVLCRPVLAKSTDLHPQIAYITRTVSSIGKMNITSKITQGLHSFQNYISFPKRPKYKDLYQNYGFIQRLSNDSIRKVKALVGAAGEDDGVSRDPITNVNPKINSKPISKAEQFFQQQDALIFPINKAKNASYSNTNIAAPLNCEPTRIYKKVSLKDGSDSGDFYDYGKVEKMQLCVELCCKDEVCDIAFMVGKTCYAIKCHDLLKCQIVSASKTTMVDTQLAYVVKKSNLHHRQVMQTVHNNERAFHIAKHKEEYRGLFDQTRMLLDERKKQNQTQSSFFNSKMH